MAGEFRVDAGEQAELNRQKELKERAAAEAAALANINTDGGYFKQTAQLLGLNRNILGQELDPNRDPNYHGETAINDLQEGISNLAKGTSDFLEGHQLGRNFKGNISNWSQMAIGAYNRMADYAAAEADRQPSTPGEALLSTIGVVGRDLENYSKGAADLLGNLKIGGKGVDPRFLNLITREGLEGLATLGAGNIARRGLRILDTASDFLPPSSGSLVPAFADDAAGSLPIRRAGEVNDFTPSNVFQTHAGHPLAMTERTGRAADSGGDILNLERLGKAQRNNRGYNTQAATDYLKSDHNLYNIQYGLAALVGESHHVGDHGLVGSIVRALKAKKGQKLLDAMEKRYIRTGNDAFQMITVPGKGKGAGARFDHVGLFHNRWYPQIETRRILEEGVKSGDIVKWSDDRIEQLLASTLKQQQRIAIGWGKWKLDTVRQLYPETMYYKPQEMRDWLNKNPQKFAQAGTVVNKKTGKVTSTAPQHFDEISNYGRTKGQDNYTNDYLRIVFDFNFGGRTAAQGLEAPMQTKFRLRNWYNPTTGEIQKRIYPKKR